MIKKVTPALSKKEKQQLVLEVAALTTEVRAPFMEVHGLPKTLSDRKKVKERIEKAIKAETISYEEIIGFLDDVVPWGKQHVYLFKGPSGTIQDWKKTAWLENHLKASAADLFALVNNKIHVGLPKQITPVAIQHSKKSLRVSFVRLREWFEHAEEHDKSGKTPEGEVIDFRAYVHRTIRNFIAFDWNLSANTAMLQISQLPGRIRYRNVKSEFEICVKPWLDLSKFSLVDLHKPILNLCALELAGNGITRAHGFEIQSLQSRSIVAKSGEGSVSVFGEASVDAVYKSMSKNGVGNLGNFYWLPRSGSSIKDELRVVLVGAKNRVNFTVPSNEKVVRRIIADIRKNS